MSIWEDIGSNYLEAASSAFPLHRLAVFGVAVLCSLVADCHEYLSVIESLARMPVSEIIDLDYGPISELVVWNIFAGIFATYGAALAKHLITSVLFSQVAKITKFRDKTEAAVRAFPPSQLMSLKDRKRALEIIDAGLEGPKKNLKNFACIAEMFYGFSLVFLFACYWGNILDLMLSVFFGTLAIFLAIKSVFVFLREYFAPALFRSQLVGGRAPDMSD